MDADNGVSEIDSAHTYSRCAFLKAGICGAAGLAGAAALAVSSGSPRPASAQTLQPPQAGHTTMPGVVGEGRSRQQRVQPLAPPDRFR